MLTSPAHPLTPAIVFDQALAALEGHLGLFAKVAQLLLDQIELDMPAIRTEVASQNTALLASSSHRLKGSLGAIAALPAWQACTALNDLARAGRVDSYALGLTHLEHELDRLSPCLRGWLDAHELKSKEQN
jgi:HPt (histidine-containing phosphotransfer) domain-containing protein